MANRNHYSSRLQDDRLAREIPGPLHPMGELGGGPAGDRLLPKLGVAVVLGLLLAAVGGLTEDRPRLTEREQLAMPGTAGPPEIVFQDQRTDRTQY
jgi:hypothetical protein